MCKSRKATMNCGHPNVRTTWGLRHDSEGRIAPDVAVAAHCVPCGERLSLGPSNDDIPLSEILVASCAHSDADLDRYNNEGAFDWDVTRPLAEQWPWCGTPQLAPDEAATVIAQSSDSFAPYDTATREPWCASAETQDSSDHVETNVAPEYAPIIQAIKDLPSVLAEPSPGWEDRVLGKVDGKFDTGGDL